MAAQFTVTDNQWYCFICGLYSGLRLRQIDYEYDVPEFEYGANIKPITSNISATIGLEIGRVLGKQGDTVLVPVFTHHVNTPYSGFTARISYDTSRLRVLTIVSSGFGSVGPVGSGADIEYQISSGVIQVVCTFDYGVSITNQADVLFYIQCSVTGEVYKDNPATLRFVNGGFTNMNYTTMLTYIVVGTEPVLYFITPLDNINGGIYSELSQTEIKLEGSSAAPPWAGSVVQGGYAHILPGGTGSFYVYAVVRDDPELGAPFPFDELRCGVSVGSDAIITDAKLFNGTGSYSNATFVQNPTREGGFYGIMMEVTVRVREETESYKVPSYIPIHPTFGILKNYATGYTYTLNTVDGFISTVPPPPGKPFWGHYDSGGWGFGGVAVSGRVWAAGTGALQVGVGHNDNKFGSGGELMGPTVSLHPGWNNISVVVPGSILPGVSGGSGGEPPGDNGYDIIISVPDGTYIFIPVGGFQWVIIPGDDKPPDKLEPPSAIKETFKKAHFDGLKFRDEIVVQLEQGHEPTNIDGLIDEIEFTDYQLTEIQVLEPVYSNINDEIEIVDFESCLFKALTIKDSNQVDGIEFTDFAVAVFSQETPDLQADEVENLVIQDISDYQVVELTIKEGGGVENLVIQDISDYQVVELTIKEGGGVDQVQLSDVENDTKVTLTISSQENTESIGLLDSNDYSREPQGFMVIACVEVKKGDYNE